MKLPPWRVVDTPIEDWLGLGAYLSEAVTNGETTVDAARAELAAEATGIAECEALERAAGVAAARFGDTSQITRLLRSATTGAAANVEAA